MAQSRKPPTPHTGAKADELPPPLDPSKFKTQIVTIDRVKRYSNNPRKNELAVRKVKEALLEFGWRQPIVVDKDFVIVVGDTRYLAAQELGYGAVPVHVADDLSPEKIRAYRIADNRVHEEAEWNAGALGVELEELLKADVDLRITGFDPDELQKLLAGNDDGAVLEPIDVKPAPAMTWVLIGIATPRYIEIAEEIEKISLNHDVFVEVAANNGPKLTKK